MPATVPVGRAARPAVTRPRGRRPRSLLPSWSAAGVEAEPTVVMGVDPGNFLPSRR